MNYSAIEKVHPLWTAKWKKSIIKLGRSYGLILPKPMVEAMGAKFGKNVSLGMIIDIKTERRLWVIDFE